MKGRFNLLFLWAISCAAVSVISIVAYKELREHRQ